jgi:hypothetical protein
MSRCMQLTWEQPVSVPPVPTPPSRKSMRPLVWCQISGPVVSLCRHDDDTGVTTVAWKRNCTHNFDVQS